MCVVFHTEKLKIKYACNLTLSAPSSPSPSQPSQTNKMQIAFHNRLRKIIKSFSIRWQLSSPLTLLSPASPPSHKSNASDSSTKMEQMRNGVAVCVCVRARERLWHTIVLMECFMVYYSLGTEKEQYQKHIGNNNKTVITHNHHTTLSGLAVCLFYFASYVLRILDLYENIHMYSASANG